MFRFYTSDIRTRRFLFYAADSLLTTPDASAIELATPDAFFTDMHILTAEESIDTIHIPLLGKGVHHIIFDGIPLLVTIDQLIDGRALFQHHGHLYKDVTITYDVLAANPPTLHAPYTCLRDIVFAILDAAHPALTAFLERYKYTSVDTITKYIFSADHGYWEVLSKVPKRSIDSVFLPPDHRIQLTEFTTTFFDPATIADFTRFFIPHKANVLLHGRPGMGKTSTIHALASLIHSHIGLITVSPKFNDEQLVYALQKTKKYGIRIVVLEDIDTLFVNRKDHDTARNGLTLSGLLNCLDGLFRGNGLMVFLTTNHIDRLDDALLRTSRIDLRIEYRAASEDQIRQCFRYYFPTQSRSDETALWRALEHLPMSMSTLQEFFFKHRRTVRIMEHIDDLRAAVRAASAPPVTENNNELVYI